MYHFASFSVHVPIRAVLVHVPFCVVFGTCTNSCGFQYTCHVLLFAVHVPMSVAIAQQCVLFVVFRQHYFGSSSGLAPVLVVGMESARSGTLLGVQQTVCLILYEKAQNIRSVELL